MNDENGSKFSRRQKWVVAIAAPVTAVMIGWVGSYVGTTITAATRLAVVENRVSTLESQRKELLDTVREIRDDVKDLKDKIDNLPLMSSTFPDLPQRILRMERTLNQIKNEHRAAFESTSEQVRSSRSVLNCSTDQVLVRAANGEYFCRKR